MVTSPTADKADDVEPFLAIPAAADFIGVSTTTIRRAIWAGELPAFKVGRVVRVRPTDIRAWVAARPAARPTVGGRR
jgi:excisionase family DNA binding protein